MSEPTAHESLTRAGLSAQFADLVLARHATELAEKQRRDHDDNRPAYHMGLPCTPGFGCHVAKLINLIDPKAQR